VRAHAPCPLRGREDRQDLTPECGGVPMCASLLARAATVAIPPAAGVLYPSFGILLKPAWVGLAMSASTVTVTVNALLLPRIKTPRSP